MSPKRSEFNILVRKHLDDLKKSRRMTQEELAERCGVGRVTIQVAGKRPRSLGYEPMLKLIDVLELSPKESSELQRAWLEDRLSPGALGAAYMVAFNVLRTVLKPAELDDVVHRMIVAYNRELAS